ncbi:GLPGLI family protein [Flavobacterium sp.]
MDRIRIVIIVVFIGLASFAQNGNITVKYTSLVDDAKDPYGGIDFKKASLVTNGSESLYTERNVDTTIVFSSGDDITYTKGKVDYHYSKDLKAKTIIYKDRYVGMGFVVKDEKYSINWTITNNLKKVMGYSCQEATGEFRGRKYKAYFLKDIPFADGPFKFDGLPGLILEVLSDDGVVKITATELMADHDLITNPFQDEKVFITFDESLKKYQLKFDKISNYKTDEGSSSTIPKRYIECYVK